MKKIMRLFFNNMAQPTFPACRVGANLIFYCPSCGKKNIHGIGDGHRGSHCECFGCYYIKEIVSGDVEMSAPNAKGQPAATEPAQHDGRGPLGCADVLGADNQPERKP